MRGEGEWNGWCGGGRGWKEMERVKGRGHDDIIHYDTYEKEHDFRISKFEIPY